MDDSQERKCASAHGLDSPLAHDRSVDRWETRLSRVLLAALPGFIVLLVALAWARPAGSLDDVFVVLSDARDLWLPGEPVTLEPGTLGETGGRETVPPTPVEGSTSLLDVAVKGLVLKALPGLDPLRVAGWLSICWLGLLAVSVVAAASRWTGSWPIAALSGVLVVLTPGLVESAGYLLEGPLFALLWGLALIAAMEARPWRCSGWSLLLVAARPEGMALAPFLLWWAGRGAPRASSRLGWGAVGVGCALAVTALRLALYGDWLPNTFYAKSSDSRWLELQDGAAYVARVLWNGSGPTLSGVALAATFLVLLRAHGRTRFLLGMAVAYALGVVISGGDSYEGARLFMPVGIPLWLGLSCSLGAVRSGSADRQVVLPVSKVTWAVSVTAAGLLFGAALGSSVRSVARAPWTLLTHTVAAVGSGPVGMGAFAEDGATFQAVADALGPNESFAHIHTQRFRWFQPNARVLDLTGLTDRRVARLPSPGPVRFGRAAVPLALAERAGAIHLDPLRGRPTSWVNTRNLVEALVKPELAVRFLGEPYFEPILARRLARDYLAASRLHPSGGGHFNLLVRRDLAAAFRRQGFRVAAD